MKKDPVFLTSILLIFFIAFVLGVYFYRFHYGWAVDIYANDNTLLKDSHAIFGQFGDFLGGILNPVLTAVNIFLLVLFNTKILYLTTSQYESQQKNFALSEDKEQIFKLIENHRHILQSIKVRKINDANKYTSFKDGIDSFWDYRGMVEKGYKKYLNKGESPEESLKQSYHFVYIEQQQRQYFGHYFRNLFHILKFIDSSKFDDNEKREYAEIVRAQLSYLELHFLFLNCLIKEGEDFKHYVIKFELLKELSEFEFNPCADENERIEPIPCQEIIAKWKDELPCPNVPT